ncbi:Anaerobic selenocysteine-containing dehydrogenase [Parafrankia irregularis]|uniref:Anaerobic selenocysteine-containing dehydrogenase n=2 Tax=Frankiaceae TaxID=74712 RepID=A0A0S4QWP5_9ACTN|nr:molybdopterin-dependent oxidoreductase [Parafrankia irregularis]CUU60033.1 Anaerobic selenocysteine-containing dehydrogenase [Parafrankia irregularis]
MDHMRASRRLVALTDWRSGRWRDRCARKCREYAILRIMATKPEVNPTTGSVTALRICPLCEATCGLELQIAGGRVRTARGDANHPLSRGYLCPKGASFPALLNDPDRLRRPLVRDRSTGAHREVSWAEAFAAVHAGLSRVVGAHGSDAVALYSGNPNAHTMAGSQHLPAFARALRTRSLFSASTVDQMPMHVACGLVFGHPGLIPVPDLDRTGYLLVLGANPAVSNGSLCTAPDFAGRLAAIRSRGGKVVVVDPRRTRTATLADEHLPIRPGSDARWLLAIVNVLAAEGLIRLRALAGHVTGVERVVELAAPFTPEAVEASCGIPADTTRRIARELAAAPQGAVYGRMGTTTVEFGATTSWLTLVLNVLTGNLDAPGGMMFGRGAHGRADRVPAGPAGQPGRPGGGRGWSIGRWRTRVRQLPEVMGELPVAALAEEIDTPGEGRLRALFTVAGNPALSTPDSGRLAAALAQLDFMVSVDPYLNETSRHADVVLPPTDSARVGHYDFSLGALAVRTVAAYSPPVLPPDPGGMAEHDILARLALIVLAAGDGTGGTGDGGDGGDPGNGGDGELPAGVPSADAVAAFHETLISDALRRAVGEPGSPVLGRDVTELRAQLDGDSVPELLLDVALRTGHFGDGFGARPDGLRLTTLLANPHGVDLGPLTPRLPAPLRTVSGTVELCPEPIVAELARLRATLDAPPQAASPPDSGPRPASDAPELTLIGRRHLRTNNSWMHNVPAMAKGRNRCTLLVHPLDAARHGVRDGGSARVTSAVGSLDVAVQVSDEMMAGVVCLPHGWGHGLAGTRMSVAAQHAGVNTNILTDGSRLDPLSGTAVLNGIPVRVTPLG